MPPVTRWVPFEELSKGDHLVDMMDRGGPAVVVTDVCPVPELSDVEEGIGCVVVEIAGHTVEIRDFLYTARLIESGTR